MAVKLFISALIAALFLRGAVFPVFFTSGNGVTAESVYLTADEALAVALNHAGMERSQIRRLEREFDRDGGHSAWDIEFSCGGFEYSCEIHAESGAVREWEREN